MTLNIYEFCICKFTYLLKSMTLKSISTHPSFRRLMRAVVKKWVSYLPVSARSWGERPLSSEEVCISHHCAITRDSDVLNVPANELSSILRCRKDEKCIQKKDGHWRNFLQRELESCGQESNVNQSTACTRTTYKPAVFWPQLTGAQ